jgi:rhamnogalacturonyl hydrolase YesR
MRHQLFLTLLLLLCFSTITKSQRAEEYITLADDGTWCWFSDPRSVSYAGAHERTYTAYATSEGNIELSYLDHRSNKKLSKVLYEKLQIDDHINPSILFLPDGRLMVFFTKHNGTIFYTTSSQAEDISQFEAIKRLELGKRLCYTNPVLLSEEDNRIYLFFRGGHDWKPSFITSEDLGKSWSKPQAFVSKNINDPHNRPYTKIISDGKASIHFAFTDGHPREEHFNSIYYLKYEKGIFSDAAGKVIGASKSLPIDQATVPKVYDGKITNHRAWIWDIAIDENAQPVLVYTVMPEETKHFYHYAFWDGKIWNDQRLCPAGSAFPTLERTKAQRDPEPHYSAGIALDHSDPSIAYLARPHGNRFEIEAWKTSDGGKTFNSKTITNNSLHDNVRPVAVRNAPSSLLPSVLWLTVDYYRHYTDFKTKIKGNVLAQKFDEKLSVASVKQVMGKVADWQIDNFHRVKHHPLDWTNGALYSGMVAWAKVAPDKKYYNWLYAIGQKHAWQPHYRLYHADDLVVSQMYLDMYQLNLKDLKSYRMLAPTQARLDYILQHPSKGSLYINYGDPQTMERWSWCDALFMAPPVYSEMTKITGDPKYLDFMHSEYLATYNFLYDKEAHLFYRDYRYFPDKQREANGEKIFWGRGNGWVMGGLVAILKDLPKDHEYRPFYETLFREMADKVAKCQDENGRWHASMLDHKSYPHPETSSSAFFCYALTYGINAGLLDKASYLPKVTKAWQALVSSVYADGKLGWVQPIGEDPKTVTAQMTEVYGVGAFLLAGTEILHLIQNN